ncbi:hypothetical protein P168DRAFT_277673 [Aspergillus campestris IBT 28561]|uniref:Uncharacterized protein n=1 Tax=Aspergillus campestris (strain IBT 28561) TaxID=1392248 RepID=A0A2I1DDV5_ASPC2|nr:uncharacterized protein P168DRAFT_277673 [Aspergillus campestris IBT 28561]PKY08041.1 hypothetical protein P168DRAFT_277673 [Aspergillus campestris IBT 28561]
MHWIGKSWISPTKPTFEATAIPVSLRGRTARTRVSFEYLLSLTEPLIANILDAYLIVCDKLLGRLLLGLSPNLPSHHIEASLTSDMEFASRTSIYGWLSKTEDCYDQSSLVRRPLSGLQSAVHPKARGLPITEKKTADTKLLQTLFTLEEGELRRYERRPRHKTKEDHYEYNGSSRTKEKHRTKSEKRSGKKKRKHTINDNFHASNVPRNRVTVLILVPPPAFSETEFLEKAPLPDKENHRIGRDKERKGGSRTGIPRKLMDRFSFDSPRANNVGQFDFMEGERSQPSDMTLLKTTNQHTGLVSSHNPRSIRSRGDSVFMSNGGLAIAGRTLDSDEVPRGRSRVPKPCNAFYFDQTQLALERLFDLYCKHLLLFDLASGDDGETANISHRTKRYWNLDELKSLLKKRQRLWGPSETGTTFAEGLHLRPSTKRRNLTPNDSNTNTARPFKRRRITSESRTEHGSGLVDYPSRPSKQFFGRENWLNERREGSSHMVMGTNDGTFDYALGLPNIVARTPASAGVSEGGGAPYPPSWIQVHGSRTPARSTSDHGLDRAGDTAAHTHNDVGIEYNIGRTLYTADLDAEYEGIVHSEGVPPGDILGSGSVDYTNDTIGATRNGSIYPAAQDLYDDCGLTVRPLSRVPFDTAGTALEKAYFPAEVQNTNEGSEFAQSVFLLNFNGFLGPEDLDTVSEHESFPCWAEEMSTKEIYETYQPAQDEPLRWDGKSKKSYAAR